jgi:hypothetical protein
MNFIQKERAVNCVIQQHIKQTGNDKCIGSLICEFFSVEPFKRCKRHKHTRKKNLCKKCGRGLLSYIIETKDASFDLYQQRRCSFSVYTFCHEFKGWVSSYDQTLRPCARICPSDSLFSTCSTHTCGFCEEEASYMLNRLVWLILCLKRMHGFRDLIPLVSEFARPVVHIRHGYKHLVQFEVTKERIDHNYFFNIYTYSYPHKLI